MEYSYVAYKKDNKIVKGRLSATNMESAIDLLNYGGYKVVKVKPHTSFIKIGNITSFVGSVKPKEVVMLSRQLALLLESGTDIVTSLELLQGQITGRALKKTLGEIVADIRSGSSLSAALRKHPKAFSQVYSRAINAGEQSGNLEVVLRQMADFIERRTVTERKIKNALTYPIMVTFLAILVAMVMVTFVLPTFTTLYTSFGSEVPMTTKILINSTDWFSSNGIYLIIGLVVLFIVGLLYIRTPAGRYQFDRIMLRLPVLGRIVQLGELSRACRTISLLFHVGLPLPEVLNLAVQGSGNKVIAEKLADVRRELVRGEGLSKPMKKRSVFLPMMVQMTSVGEETGNLDNTLSTVAVSYEVEADERTTNAIGLIQPVVTIGIGLMVGFLALTLVSSMYSMYGEMGF